MKIPFILWLAVFACFSFGAAEARAECECPPNSVEQAVIAADRVFTAEVVSARIGEDDPQAIQFVVKVRDTIRGEPATQLSLVTALPDSCGMPVRLGFVYLYVLGPGQTRLSRCALGALGDYVRTVLLHTAIALVDLPVSDARGAQRLLSEGLRHSRDRETIGEFFDLVERIDPTGNTAIRTDDHIQYRGIKIHIIDGRYESVELL